MKRAMLQQLLADRADISHRVIRSKVRHKRAFGAKGESVTSVPLNLDLFEILRSYGKNYEAGSHSDSALTSQSGVTASFYSENTSEFWFIEQYYFGASTF